MQGDNTEIESKLKARQRNTSQLRKRDDQTYSEGRNFYCDSHTDQITGVSGRFRGLQQLRTSRDLPARRSADNTILTEPDADDLRPDPQGFERQIT